ncbi:MAG: tyrosine-type recombinase/integrase [Anaerolineae bacterium]|nr:tyrosine-type recombinase/integrase [Anaerolineae bacterium]
MASLKSVYEDWLVAMLADGLDEKTVAWHKSLTGAFVETRPHLDVAEITVTDLRNYLAGQRKKNWKHTAGSKEKVKEGEGYAEWTFNGISRSLHKFFKWVAQEYGISNPMLNIKYPKQPKPDPTPVNLEDVIRIFQSLPDTDAGKRDGGIFGVMYDMPVRREDLVNIRMEHLDTEAWRLQLVKGKNGESRSLKVPLFAQTKINQWLAVREESEWLFYNLSTRGKLEPDGISQMIKRRKRRAGVKGSISSHRWRKGFAVEFILNGGDIATLSKIMGHKDVATTARYYLKFTQGQIEKSHEKYTPGKRLARVLKKRTPPTSGGE